MSRDSGKYETLTFSELREEENTLYVVMEKGETDLATFLKTRRTEIDSAFIRYHWREMLRCVKVIHDRSGSYYCYFYTTTGYPNVSIEYLNIYWNLEIVHSDLKPANFLLVKGNLKLIDFGIAAGIPNDMVFTHYPKNIYLFFTAVVVKCVIFCSDGCDKGKSNGNAKLHGS